MFNSIKENIEHSIEINKSVFICSLFKCMNKEEALLNIQDIKKMYPDATHHCFAFLTNSSQGMDDDGEPGGTAGLPIYSVLEKNQLMNIGAVVTRYFGGVKLGAGGLIRAYSKVVSQCIKEATIVTLKTATLYRMTFDYSLLKTIENEIIMNQLIITEKFFNEQIDIYFLSTTSEIQNYFISKYQNQISISSLGNEFIETDGELYV